MRNATCKYCAAEIVWGQMLNGQFRSFDRAPVPIADTAPATRYAYSRRARAVVNLDGERNPPPRVLVMHHCAQYAAARRAELDKALTVDGSTMLEALGLS
jgi:hypothetical protein